MNDLDQLDSVWDPEMSLLEKPESLLQVNDGEVKVEKFLTPEQRKKQEELNKLEEERLAKERGDNARERALDQMMGGVLEIKKEDELKKDVPMPKFMTDKNQDDWNEDEQRLAKEYEKRVKELQEEREKYRKQLETELKKLQGFIQESTGNYDDMLQQFFMRKVKTEMAIYQEELKMLRLRYSLLVEDELTTQEKEIERLLEQKRQLKNQSAKSVVEARKLVEEYRQQYDRMAAEDSVRDKRFKLEFKDVPAVQVEQLYKLFRRRPRGQKVGGLRDTPSHGDLHMPNPFSDRPSTARQRTLAQQHLETALQDLDKESNMPEGVDPFVWDRLCDQRRQKIESEQMVKQMALTLADMNAYVQRRQQEDEALKADIEDLITGLNKLRENRIQFTINLEVQLLLKQGLVEVDAYNFIHDFRDSILIHRSVVEDLNAKIRELGEKKISSMVESKDFRKGIVQQEWERKRMVMQMEDLMSKLRDIQMLKVTREIQAYLNEEDHEAKKAQEIAILEQTIANLKEFHEKNINERKKIIKELKKNIRDRQGDNNDLDDNLEELNVTVNERNHISEVNADKHADYGREKRYQQIVTRRRLVDLAKAQAQEVAVLRAEVERLRMRTFPALVQVER